MMSSTSPGISVDVQVASPLPSAFHATPQPNMSWCFPGCRRSPHRTRSTFNSVNASGSLQTLPADQVVFPDGGPVPGGNDDDGVLRDLVIRLVQRSGCPARGVTDQQHEGYRRRISLMRTYC